MSQNTNNDEKYQIISDSEYIQNQKRIPDKLNFNLEALEYQPKELNQYNEDDDDDEEFDELMKEELDKIIGDIIEKEAFEELKKEKEKELDTSLDESEDEDKWVPDYKGCECCGGFIYKCNGKTCSSLGVCYCKMKDDINGENIVDNNEIEKTKKMPN